MIKTLFLFCLLSASMIAHGDDGLDETELKGFLKKQKFELDSAANAIVLDEKGDLTITFTERSFYYDYKYSNTTRILNDRGFDVTDVEVKLQPNQQIKSVKASVISLKGNKVVVKEEQNPVDYTDHGTYKTARISFTKPKAGDVISYSYLINTQRSIDFPAWNFEDKYPKVHSEYSIIYDAGLDIAVIDSRRFTFPIVDSDKDLLNCKSCRFDPTRNDRLYNFSKATYARNNVPAAYVPEIFSGSNNTGGEWLKVQIVRFRNYKLRGNSANIYTSNPEFVGDFELNTWDEVNKKFLFADSKLGGLAHRNNGDVERLSRNITKNTDQKLQKAMAIYTYVRDSFETVYNGKESIYASQKTNELLDSRKGTAADKNILLVGLLEAAGIKASPFVTCTDGENLVTKDFPAYAVLNYTMAYAEIDGQNYTLDASSAGLGFGEVKPECHNSAGIVVARSLRFVEPERLTGLDKNIYLFDIDLKQPEQGRMTGKLRLGKMSSARIRGSERAKTQADFAKQFVLSVLQQLPLQAKLLSFNVTNLDKPDSLIVIDFNSSAQPLQSNTGVFDPFLIKTFSYNPAYRLDASVSQNSLFVFNYLLPATVLADNLPKGSHLVLGNNSLVYNSNISYDANDRALKVSYKVQTNPESEIIFTQSDYERFSDKIKEEQAIRIRINN